MELIFFEAIYDRYLTGQCLNLASDDNKIGFRNFDTEKFIFTLQIPLSYLGVLGSAGVFVLVYHQFFRGCGNLTEYRVMTIVSP